MTIYRESIGRATGSRRRTSSTVSTSRPEAHAASGRPDAQPILDVHDLKMYFPVKSAGHHPPHRRSRPGGRRHLLPGPDRRVRSASSASPGCGKSTTGRLITRLYKPTGGSIGFEGQDITKLSAGGLKPLRREIQMIFQDPYSSLNPRHTVGAIIGAPMLIHKTCPKKQVLPRVQELLEIVGLNPEHYNRYPHEFSGGQRQRIGIARALTLKPKLLVADEPVSALDVSIQAQVINLLQDIQDEFGIAFLFIAHDLAVVRHFCPEVAVMYLGKIVEIGDRETASTCTPTTPTPRRCSRRCRTSSRRRSAAGASGSGCRATYPARSTRRPGCRFRTRCPIAQEICARGRAAAAPDRQAAQGRLPLRGRARVHTRPSR